MNAVFSESNALDNLNNNINNNINNNRGIILLAALLMLATIIGVTFICAFPLAREADDEIRYKITMQRIREIKRAFFGRIAEKEGGADINISGSACGGFLSDFGMPSDGILGRADPFGTGNFLDVLLKGNEVTDVYGIGWEKWHYDMDKKYWAGYRGERYLSHNSFDSDGNPQFVDGWGNPFKVVISGCGHEMRVKCLGADGKTGGAGYAADIVERFFFVAHDEDIVIEVANRTEKSVILDVGMVFPLFGRVVERYTGAPKEIGKSGKGEFRFRFPLDAVDDATGPPSGTCKIVLRDQAGGILQANTVCLPTGNGRDTLIRVDYEL